VERACARQQRLKGCMLEQWHHVGWRNGPGDVVAQAWRISAR
jgi:hypothetical protein